MPGHSGRACADYVNLSAMPGIHVFATGRREKIRGWPGHLARRRASRFCPAMTQETSIIAQPDDPTHSHPDRTDRDPDVVVACGADGGDRENSRLPARGDDVRDRRAGRVPDLDRTA